MTANKRRRALDPAEEGAQEETEMISQERPAEEKRKIKGKPCTLMVELVRKKNRANQEQIHQGNISAFPEAVDR